MSQGAKVQQHSNLASRTLRIGQRFTDKNVRKPVCSIGWVGDDILGQWLFAFEEILPPISVSAHDQIRGIHGMTSGF